MMDFVNCAKINPRQPRDKPRADGECAKYCIEYQCRANTAATVNRWLCVVEPMIYVCKPFASLRAPHDPRYA